MTNPERINEVQINDRSGKKRIVKPGNLVELLPPSPSGREKDRAHLSPESFDFLNGWLGEGPFKISWIGLWPCGRAMLYLHRPNGEPGAYASDFRYAG